MWIHRSGGNPDSDIETKSSFALVAGTTYTISFSFGNTGGDNMVRLRIGTAFDETFDTLATPLGTVTRTFTATTQSATIRFTDLGPADNVGATLDNIVLSSDTGVGAVPEPSTVGLIGLGLAALAWARRHQSRLE